ncbi:MAG: peptidoglycan DD-metalloendopeptidase family protein [Lachnospiraceae bacterium]|nr:peptidoglycan DD-metalloendopeptidase family protein [Lachnospiraceae bacterium]
MAFIRVTALICFICLIYIPKVLTTEVISENNGYCNVYLNDVFLGAMNSYEEAENALIQARGRMSAEAGGLVYLNPVLTVEEEQASFGERIDVDNMAVLMYQELKGKEISFSKTDAYVVRINDYTVILSTKDDIVKLVERIKANYDTDEEFRVRLTGNAEADSEEIGVEIVKADMTDTAASRVITFDGVEATIASDENTVFADGDLAMAFSEDITIVPVQVSSNRITTYTAAAEDITKETASKTIYTVVAGDTLSQIASRYNLTTQELCALNDGLSEDGIIGVGDKIVVTVPTPELSIRNFRESTYEEDYDAEVQYVDDDTMYQGQYDVIEEGTSGHREVVAVIEEENGREVNRTLIKEVIMVESSPRILRRGTAIPPTYIKPLAGGTFTSGFGMRWGRLHAGVDWGTPVGTSIMASSGGTVVRSGWFSGYGICVDIQHPDGKLTRYGHLSKTKVSVGQKVVQGQQIALSGNTGDSTGPHLHFEIRVNGTPVNPFTYLD